MGIAVRVQHAVGQGGFASGTIWSERNAITYVYDCGAEGGGAPTRLREEVRSFCRPTQYPVNFDALFVSHFDRDHTNGIGDLLAQWKPAHVFLPYLTPVERFEFVVEAAATTGSDRLDRDYIEKVRDPSAWFRERGVENTTLIVGGGDGLPGRQDDRPSPDLGDERDQEVGGLTLDAPSPHAAPAGSPDGASARFASHSDPITIVRSGAGRAVVWQFLLHTRFIDDDRRRDFERAIDEELKRENLTIPEVMADAAKLIPLLESREKLARLSRVYRAVWPGSGRKNHTSMSLLSGPPTSRAFVEPCAATTRPRHIEPSRWLDGYGWWPPLWYRRFLRSNRARAAWLSTGDAPLSDRLFRDDLLRHYGSHLDRVRTFVLPHHGSRHSFHSEVLERIKPLQIVAAAGRESRYDHPHSDVVLASLQHAPEFRHVHEEPDSAVADVCWFP